MKGSHHAMVTFGVAATVIPIGTAEGLASLALAVAFSRGSLSPDVDLGSGRHRRTTHQVEYVAMAGLLLTSVAWAAGAWWVGASIALGWSCHLLGDALFGKGGRTIPKGVGLGARRIGTGWKCGGTREWVVAHAFWALGILALVLRLAL